MTLTPGKYRALQRCSTESRKFAILALDHQVALRRTMRPDDPASLCADDLTAFKLDAVTAMAHAVSGVLLDPIYSAAQAVAAGLLNRTGLLVELERADYQMQPMPLDVEIDADWCVTKIKRMGADGVKLFYYYNPNNAQQAARQDAVVRGIAADCARWDIPFYAEPIYYVHAPGESKQEAVIEAARRAAQAGADVLKLEFPVDTARETDERHWAQGCEAITAAVNVPWVLLSAGVPFEGFARQLEIACRAGASGFIVGRALWDDGARATDATARRAWLAAEGQRRLKLLCAITESNARPWHELYPTPEVTPQWFRQYQSGVCND